MEGKLSDYSAKTLAIFAVLIGLIVIGAVSVTTCPGGPPIPAVWDFHTTTPVIYEGDSAILVWHTKHAGSAEIIPEPGRVSLSGSTTVSPNKTTIYTLTAFGVHESEDFESPAYRSLTITVIPPYKFSPSSLPKASDSKVVPIIIRFTANPNRITCEEVSYLEWEVSNADSIKISPAIGQVNSGGQATVHPTLDTTYTLTATNSAGSVTRQASVTVSAH